jgi:aspartyl-tRNA(Asn)/glutamyl-tRNA(Gln) amidotransferase subunit C
MPSISEQELRKLCKLARLNPEKEDLAGLAQHFDKMLGHMEALRALDLADVEPLANLDADAGHLRPDVPGESLGRAEVFANTPHEEYGHFSIPKVIGG